jgi:hypothetical protein
VEIAAMARQGKIFDIIGAAVLFRPDVFDMVP